MPDGSTGHDGRDNTGGCALLEVHLDGCIVRRTIKGSRHAQNLKGYPCPEEVIRVDDQDTIFVLLKRMSWSVPG